MTNAWLLALGFLFQWLLWWCWINTVGRFPGGLGMTPTLVFDVLSGCGWVLAHRSGLLPLLRFPLFSRLHLRLWLIPALIALASALFYATILEPIDWDGLDYHLPAILQAIQFKHWGLLEDPYYAVRGYPMLVESLYLYWILHLGHHFYLLVGFVPLVLGAIGLDELARHYSVSRRWVFLLWLTLPIVIKQVSSLYIDHFVAAFGILAFAGLVRKRQIAFALPLAFFVGSKLSAGVPATFLVLGWFVRHRSIPGWAVLFCSLSLAGTLLPNWIHFQNPLYPFTIAPLGYPLFPGLFEPGKFVAGVPWAAEPFYQRFYRAFFQFDFPAHWDMLKGPWGAVQGGVLAGALIAQLWTALRKKSLKSFFLPEVIIAFVVSGGNWILRYQLWATGVFLLWGAWFLQKMPHRAKQMIWCLLVAQSCFLWMDLSWMIGNGEALRTAWAHQSPSEFLGIVETRWQELLAYGEPQSAVHPVDQKRIQVRKTHGQTYRFCPKERPQQFAAYYGRDFTNSVYFDEAVCGDKGRLN